MLQHSEQPMADCIRTICGQAVPVVFAWCICVLHLRVAFAFARKVLMGEGPHDFSSEHDPSKQPPSPSLPRSHTHERTPSPSFSHPPTPLCDPALARCARTHTHTHTCMCVCECVYYTLLCVRPHARPHARAHITVEGE